MNAIKVFNYGTREYNALKFAAAAMTLASSEVRYEVEDTYFDYGQGWKWTTVIAHKNRPEGYCTDSWQALNPREQEAIVFAENPEEICKVISEWRNGKYNPDKSVRA